METYTAMRHFADSWGLLAMTIFFVGVVLFTFRPGARKAAENALAAGFPERTKDELTERIVSCGHKPTVRGETLSIPEFAALARAIAE